MSGVDLFLVCDLDPHQEVKDFQKGVYDLLRKNPTTQKYSTTFQKYSTTFQKYSTTLHTI